VDQHATDDGAARGAAEVGDASPNRDAFAAATIGTLFQRSALRHTARPALWVDGDAVSYGDLLSLASRISQSLIGAGFGGGSARCAVLGSRKLHDFAGVAGASMARCTYVPLNARHPPQRLAQIMREADAQALVVDGEHLAHARAVLHDTPQSVLVLLPDSSTAPDWAIGTHHRFLSQGDLAKPRLDVLPGGNPEDGAYLLFTSGSTGAPKGVLVRNRNVMPYLRSVAARYTPGPGDRCTQLFDLTFDLSVHDMFVAWGAGASLYRVPDSARFAPRDFVRRHALTTWFSVPSTAATMLGLRALRPDDFPSLRLSLFCGEALPKRLARAWAAAAPNAVIENLYGPTEATIALTAWRLPREEDALETLPEILPIGTPLPGQSAIAVNAADTPAHQDEDGELCVAGSQVTDGYWRRSDLTAQRFVRFAWDDRVWYRTGDRVRNSLNHGLVFLGRLDRQVKIAGHRVELQEVEAVLHRAADTNAAAIAWPMGPDGLARGIVGFVGKSSLPDDALLQACRNALPPYAVPSAIRRVDEWPLNNSGKTDHSRLRAIMEAKPCNKV
jgi:D-alanine--poly(phosphoribitol) ligase subunit 1